jgi:hypothetical protein
MGQWLSRLARVTTLLMAIDLSPTIVLAQGGPFLGSTSCGYHVTQPSDDPTAAKIDGGYFVDQECTTVYVKPPVIGRFELSGIAKSGSLNICPVAYKNIFDGYTAATEKEKDSVLGNDPTKVAQWQIVADALFSQLLKFDNVPGFTASALLSID